MVFVFQGAPAQAASEQERLQSVMTQFHNALTGGAPARQLQSILDDNIKNKTITPVQAVNILRSYSDEYLQKNQLTDKKTVMDLLIPYYQRKVNEAPQAEKPAVSYADKVATAADEVLQSFRDKASVAGFTLYMNNALSEKEFKKDVADICKQNGVKQEDVVKYMDKQQEDYASCVNYFKESDNKDKAKIEHEASMARMERQKREQPDVAAAQVGEKPQERKEGGIPGLETKKAEAQTRTTGEITKDALSDIERRNKALKDAMSGQ